MYIGYRKRSDPLKKLFHCSHLLKSEAFFFFINNVNSATHLERKNGKVQMFANLLKKKD